MGNNQFLCLVSQRLTRHVEKKDSPTKSLYPRFPFDPVERERDARETLPVEALGCEPASRSCPQPTPHATLQRHVSDWPGLDGRPHFLFQVIGEVNPDDKRRGNAGPRRHATANVWYDRI